MCNNTRGPTGEFFQLKSWFYYHASHIHLSLAYCLSFLSFFQAYTCLPFLVSPSLLLFLSIAFLSLSLNPSLTFCISSFSCSPHCVSLSPRVNLDPSKRQGSNKSVSGCTLPQGSKTVSKFPSLPCLPACCRCTSVCLCTWHACLHAVSFAERVSGKQDVRLRKGWMMVYGGFVSYRFACIQEHTIFLFYMTHYTSLRLTLVSHLYWPASSLTGMRDPDMYVCIFLLVMVELCCMEQTLLG